VDSIFSPCFLAAVEMKPRTLWASRSRPWSRQANALGAQGEPIRFCVTHPYHPLCGQTFELAAQNREFGEDRVFYRDPDGRMRYLAARWTSLAAPDPFVIAAAGRAYFRLEDLVRLAEQMRDLQA
jgi:hypothetical protein